MKNKLKIIIPIIILIIVIIGVIVAKPADNAELKTIKSNKELMQIYKGNTETISKYLITILGMPFTSFHTMRI